MGLSQRTGELSEEDIYPKEAAALPWESYQRETLPDKRHIYSGPDRTRRGERSGTYMLKGLTLKEHP